LSIWSLQAVAPAVITAAVVVPVVTEQILLRRHQIHQNNLVAVDLSKLLSLQLQAQLTQLRLVLVVLVSLMQID